MNVPNCTPHNRLNCVECLLQRIAALEAENAQLRKAAPAVNADKEAA